MTKKTMETYVKVALRSFDKGDKLFARGVSAARSGDRSTANQLFAGANTCYGTASKALNSALKAPKK
jgi:hypothetical protein